MARPIIPADRQGYMIVGSTVHTRYATHVERGLRLRTIDEAFASVARTEYTVCETCYRPEPTQQPRQTRAPRSAAPARPAPRRREESSAAPTATTAPAPAALPDIDDLPEGS